MNFLDVVFSEELTINSGEDTLDKLFRHALNEVFSAMYVKKIDRLFNTTLKFSSFNQRTNIMCYTQGLKIYINRPLFKNTTKEKAMDYIMHEMFHVLTNSGKFPELSILQKKLAVIVSKNVKKTDIAEFFSGKKQNIHSVWQGEVLSYLCNNAIKWDKAKKDTKKLYYNELKESNIFNLESNFWKKRFSKM